MTTLFLTVMPQGIQVRAQLDVMGCCAPCLFFDMVRPEEMFGGYSYEELLEIAQKKGQIDANELMV